MLTAWLQWCTQSTRLIYGDCKPGKFCCYRDNDYNAGGGGDEDNDDHYPGGCWDVDDGNCEFGDNGNKFSVIYRCTPSTDLVAERLQRGQKAKTLRLCGGDVAFCQQLHFFRFSETDFQPWSKIIA